MFGYDNLSARCRQILDKAATLSLWIWGRKENPTAESILLAILECNNTMAHQILSQFCDIGEVLDKLKSAIKSVFVRDDLQELLKDALAEAAYLSKGYIGTEHLLLAISRTNTLAGVIVQGVVKLEQLREAISRADKQIPQDEEIFQKITYYLSLFPKDGNKTEAINQISAYLHEVRV